MSYFDPPDKTQSVSKMPRTDSTDIAELHKINARIRALRAVIKALESLYEVGYALDCADDIHIYSEHLEHELADKEVYV